MIGAPRSAALGAIQSGALEESNVELAEELGCLPIELALAYVLNKHPNIFPLVGPRSIYESESCMQASKINLTEDQLDWLIS